MSHPKGHDSNLNFRYLMDRALESNKGIEVTLPSEKEAKKAQTSCYVVRHRSRRELAKVLKFGDPKIGSTPYDILVLEVHGPVLKILRADKIEYDVKEIE